jgi:hypothetical protein
LPKCGEVAGFLTKHGKPCGQSINPESKGCKFHLSTPAERHDIAMKGALNASLKHVLPDDFDIGELVTIEDMKAFLKKMIPHVLKHPIERWRSAEARGWFGHLVELDRNRVQEKLADAVLTAQHGGQSLVFLNQFLDGSLESRRKIPSRVKALTDESELAS